MIAGIKRGYEHEPALLNGLITAILGSLVLIGVEGDTMQALATAFGVAGGQMVLTRQSVYSPAAVAHLREHGGFGSLLSMQAQRGGFATEYEPANTAGAMALIAGFFVQFFVGVDLTTALATSAGLAGFQAGTTRPLVYSPATAIEAACPCAKDEVRAALTQTPAAGSP